MEALFFLAVWVLIVAGIWMGLVTAFRDRKDMLLGLPPKLEAEQETAVNQNDGFSMSWGDVGAILLIPLILPVIVVVGFVAGATAIVQGVVTAVWSGCRCLWNKLMIRLGYAEAPEILDPNYDRSAYELFTFEDFLSRFNLTDKEKKALDKNKQFKDYVMNSVIDAVNADPRWYGIRLKNSNDNTNDFQLGVKIHLCCTYARQTAIFCRYGISPEIENKLRYQTT